MNKSQSKKSGDFVLDLIVKNLAGYGYGPGTGRFEPLPPHPFLVEKVRKELASGICKPVGWADLNVRLWRSIPSVERGKKAAPAAKAKAAPAAKAAGYGVDQAVRDGERIMGTMLKLADLEFSRAHGRRPTDDEKKKMKDAIRAGCVSSSIPVAKKGQNP